MGGRGDIGDTGGECSKCTVQAPDMKMCSYVKQSYRLLQDSIPYVHHAERQCQTHSRLAVLMWVSFGLWVQR